MDADRLASVLRSLKYSGSRRTVLGVVLGGRAVLQRLTQAEAATRKKRKKSPCTRQPNDASCKGTGRCLSGVCNPQPACLPYPAMCTSPQSCCGHVCFSEPGGPGECLGGEVGVGGACQVNKDCAAGLGCLGYVCQSTSCGPASDACVDQTL